MSQLIVITGAAGFIGSSLAQALLRRGERVLGIDNFDPFYAESMKQANLASIERVASPGQFEFHRADITDAGAMRELLTRARPRALLHMAAKAGVRPSLADPAGYAHANVTGTSVVLAVAREAGVQRLVIASSSSVYGNNEKTPFSEEDRVDRPISPYAATKLATEAVAHANFAITRTPTACLRFFTVYGPRQRPDLAIRLFMDKISRGEPIPFFGDGSMSRDFTYIDDIVSGVLAALDRIDRFGFRIWNLGSDSPVTLTDLVEKIGRTVGREPRLDRRPSPPGDVLRTWADLSRVRTDLGYAPSTAIDTGLQNQWQWMRSTNKNPGQGPGV